MHPTYKQEKDKIPNTKETSTPNTESATKITQTLHPIRPVINNMNAPNYKVAKHLVKLLNRHFTLKINTILKTPQTWRPV